MSQTVVRAEQTLFVGDGIQILVEHLLGIHDRTNLQQIELASTIIVQITCELYLHRTLHLIGTILLGHLQQLGQREHSMLEHTTEGDHLSATFVDTIANNLIRGIVGRGNISERTVFGSLFHTQVLDIKAIVHLEVIAHMGHVQGIEAGLCLRQSRLHL